MHCCDCLLSPGADMMLFLVLPKNRNVKHTVMQVDLLFLWVGNLVSYIKELVESLKRARF